jgi:hypothetical protein
MPSSIRKLYNDITSVHKHGATHDVAISGGTGLAIGLASRNMASAPVAGAAIGAVVLYSGALLPPSSIKSFLHADLLTDASKAAVAIGVAHMAAGTGHGGGGKHHGELDMGSAQSDLMAAAREL